jgi:predicted ribosomally synthesized peptide with SipW-like signal peptide
MLVSSLLGTTFAWFTDQATSMGNTIQAGSLNVDLSHKYEDAWVSLKQNPNHKVFNYEKWEPGYTEVESLKVDNLGSLALQYQLSLEFEYGTAIRGENGENLADVIDVYVTKGEDAPASYEALKNSWERKGTLAEVMRKPAEFLAGELLPTGKVLDANASASTAVGSQIFSIALHMQEDAGNEYKKLSVGNVYVNLIATQWGSEDDSFGKDYDNDAVFPELNIGGFAIDVNTLNNVVTDETSATGTGVSAIIPAGVVVEDGVSKLGLTVKEKTASDANVTLNDGEALRALDVHIDGVAASNTVPMLITVEKAMKPGLNLGNYTLYHVEGGTTVTMTVVNSLAELDAHNEIYYDPATGNVTLAMATFSEVTLVAEVEAKSEGGRDYAWYDGKTSPYTIANADQLAGLSAIVGGMAAGRTQDSFADKTIKLACDINIGDLTDNEIVF